MTDLLLRGGTLINEGSRTEQDILIRNGRIENIGPSIHTSVNCKELDVSGKWILPGLIDDQVHFREPGLTHKACIYTESQAAVAGGVTTYFEMPNVSPPLWIWRESKKSVRSPSVTLSPTTLSFLEQAMKTLRQ